MPVFVGEVTLSGPAGQYVFAATLEHGGAPAGGRLTFHLSEPPTVAPVTVAASRLDARVQEWLKARGVSVTTLDATQVAARHVILIGDWNEANVQPRRDVAGTELRQTTGQVSRRLLTTHRRNLPDLRDCSSKGALVFMFGAVF